MKKLSELSPEEKRVLAAEACGIPALLLDYANDLNAMHEAEKTLTDEEYSRYVWCMLQGKPPHYVEWREFFSAVAAQRLDAFLLAKNLVV